MYIHQGMTVVDIFQTGGVSQLYPVMFYIHGGEYSRGASNLFPAHIMATFYKVVVVTFNYRLGALGTIRDIR